MSVKIIIDSTADVTEAVRARVEVVPLTIRFGEAEYFDGVTIGRREFYERLVESDALPTTSQATPDAFAEIFERVRLAGDSAVVITISAELSGTCQSAMIAAEDYGNIFVVDSRSASIGSGILVEQALRLADAGLSAPDIAAELRRCREKVVVIALLDTLEYLKRGGRLSKTAAFAGGLLNIKPVAGIREGKIVVLGKARGSRQANNLLTEEIRRAGGVDFEKPILLGYTGLSDALLQKYRQDSAALWQAGERELPAALIGSVIGTHAGPGAVAAAFFRP